MMANRYMIVDTAANRMAKRTMILVKRQYSFRFHVAENEMRTALINNNAATFLSDT
jgi:hypothetical protein